MEFHTLLQDAGLTSGPVYATGLLKGYEAARMIADFKAQETIHADHDRIIREAELFDALQERLMKENLALITTSV